MKRQVGAAVLIALVALGWLLRLPLPAAAAGPYDCRGDVYGVVPASEAIANGGFEQNLSGWYTDQGAGTVNSPTISTTIVHAGARSAQVDAVPTVPTHAEENGTYSSALTVYSFWFYPQTWGPGGILTSEFLANWDHVSQADVMTGLSLYPTSLSWSTWKRYGSSGNVQTIPYNVTVGQWHSFEIVMDSARGVQCLYVDGVAEATVAVSPASTFDADVVLFGDATQLGDAGVAYYDDESLQSVSPVDYVPTNPTPAAPVLMGESLSRSFSLDVYNQGNLSANATATLAFYHESTSGTPFATFTVPPLAPRASAGPFVASWRSPAAPGTYRIVADVDYANSVAEANESNNQYTWSVTVVPPPVTVLSVGAPNVIAGTTYVTSATPLSFLVQDRSGTGIRRTEYRIDGGAWQTYVAPFTLSSEGNRSLEWYSEDNVSNVEPTQTATLAVDNTPPVTALALPAARLSVDSGFQLSAVDVGSGVARIEYRTDGGAWRAYNGSFALSVGAHTIGYRATDRLGNAEPERTTVVRIENWKPIIAALFTVVLAFVAVLLAWRARRKDESRWKWVLAVGAVFAVAEAVTGILSALLGVLPIPPYLDLGTIVDGAILAMGLVVAVFLYRRTRPPALTAKAVPPPPPEP